jgi:hypothetical protein
MAKHTPGPWQIEGSKFITSSSTGGHVATIPDVVGSQANARLIAAAPEVVAELRALTDIVESLIADRDERAAYVRQVKARIAASHAVLAKIDREG